MAGSRAEDDENHKQQYPTEYNGSAGLWKYGNKIRQVRDSHIRELERLQSTGRIARNMNRNNTILHDRVARMTEEDRAELQGKINELNAVLAHGGPRRLHTNALLSPVNVKIWDYLISAGATRASAPSLFPRGSGQAMMARKQGARAERRVEAEQRRSQTALEGYAEERDGESSGVSRQLESDGSGRGGQAGGEVRERDEAEDARKPKASMAPRGGFASFRELAYRPRE